MHARFRRSAVSNCTATNNIITLFNTTTVIHSNTASLEKLLINRQRENLFESKKTEMENQNLITMRLLMVIIIITVTVFVSTSVFGRCQYEHYSSASPNNGASAVQKELSLPRTTLMVVEDGLHRNDGWRGSSCNTLNDPCCSGCFCVPIGLLWVGWCEGICC